MCLIMMKHKIGRQSILIIMMVLMGLKKASPENMVRLQGQLLMRD